MKSRFLIIAALMSTLVLASCAGPSGAMNTNTSGISGRARPGWIDAAPKNSSSTLYFVAGSGWRRAEGEARQAAVTQASAQIANYFGALVKASTSDIQSAGSSGDSARFVLKADVVGTQVVIRGIEERDSWCVPQASGFECFVLIAYPVREYERARQEVAAAEADYRLRQSQAASRALSLYKTALGEESSASFDSALSRLQQAEGILKTLKIPIDLSDRSLSNTDLLSRAVAEALARVGAMNADSASWLAIGVVAKHDSVRSGKVERKLFSDLAGLAQRYSLKTRAAEIADDEAEPCLSGDPALVRLRASGAGHMLVLDLSSRFSSEVYGQFFARASGRWALIETKTGRIVASGNVVDEKGAGVSREAACDSAVDHAWTAQINRNLTGALEKIRR